MKNKFCLGLLMMVLAFGMTVIGCDDGGGDAFAGTWVLAINDGLAVKIIAADGAFTQYQGGEQVGKGTYTVSGSTVNVTFTHGCIDGKTWTAYDSLPKEYKDNVPKNMEGTITGDSLAINEVTLTRKAGGSDGFTGTWIYWEKEGEVIKGGTKIANADGFWRSYAWEYEDDPDDGDWLEQLRGTYTVTSSTAASSTITHVNEGYFAYHTEKETDDDAEFNDDWKTWTTAKQEIKTALGGSATFPATISGNSFTAMTHTFVKQ